MTQAAKGYCDLVMKGGIASGIVYPNAVLELERKYRFRNIGGTSAGAIAAAATAAAALGERRKTIGADPGTATNPDSGFAGFRLCAEQFGRQGFIRNLFQPAAGNEAAFRLMLALTGETGTGRKALAVARAVIAAAWAAPLLIVVLLVGGAALLGGPWSALWMSIPASTVAAAVGTILAALRMSAGIRDSLFGLCIGRTSQGASQPALTDWFHATLQKLSAQPADQPLLFRHLWEAPREEGEPEGNAVTLEMITTSVSHQEPRSLPLQKVRFWFRRDDFMRLFPEKVVEWMIDQYPADEIAGETYHRLPIAGEMPVIVAMRMSLSFPILLSAVRLYEAHWPRAGDEAERRSESAAYEGRARLRAVDSLATGGRDRDELPPALRPCWFSDGGISSNLPLHLFDAPLPRWPTFAIDLVDDPTPQDTPSPPPWLPAGNNMGWKPTYRPIAGGGAAGEIASLLFGMITTMQSWRDRLQSRAPGHRDRIVHVPLKKHEGGLNLDMPQPVLTRIAEKGAAAGAVLRNEFDFANHWWIRWRNVASSTERFTIRFAAAAAATPTPDYADALSSARDGAPEAPSYRLEAAQKKRAQQRFAEMEQKGLAWKGEPKPLTEGAPHPLPELRIVPLF
jgi:predicted acylesterase/phospholipase RssA